MTWTQPPSRPSVEEPPDTQPRVTPPDVSSAASSAPDEDEMRRNSGPAQHATFAALDLGTNNCRLLIARRAPGVHSFGEIPFVRLQHGQRPKSPFRIVDSYSRIVRLGEGLGQRPRLCEDAIERTLAALRVCANKLARTPDSHIRCVATEACRAAENCQDFLTRVKQETGITLELISGEEEAYLGLLGCAPLMNPRKPFAVIFDIGGGSTEVSWIRIKPGRRPIRLASLSVPFGVVTLAERYGSASPFDRPNEGSLSLAGYAAIRADMARAVQDFARQHDIARHLSQQKVQLIGTSGTVTTLSSIVQGLERYDRMRVDGSYLTGRAAERICGELLAMTNQERAQIKSIGNNRADLVMPGCAVLQGILDVMPAERIRVADRGLREGMLYELMHKTTRPNARQNLRHASPASKSAGRKRKRARNRVAQQHHRSPDAGRAE